MGTVVEDPGSTSKVVDQWVLGLVTLPEQERLLVTISAKLFVKLVYWTYS